jgi:alginate O-acetyltransferase complex protein AlgI
MLFNSLEFFAFLAAVLVVQAALPATPRKVALLGASYLFYGFWDWRFLALIAFSTVVDFGGSRLASR